MLTFLMSTTDPKLPVYLLRIIDKCLISAARKLEFAVSSMSIMNMHTTPQALGSSHRSILGGGPAVITELSQDAAEARAPVSLPILRPSK